jgi:hypothetical protein
MAGKIDQSKQYQQLRKMIATKNSQLKGVRVRLAKYALHAFHHMFSIRTRTRARNAALLAHRTCVWRIPVAHFHRLLGRYETDDTPVADD